MIDRPKALSSRSRIVIGALLVGLMFAAVSGVGTSSSGVQEANQPVSTATVQTTISPIFAFIGFLIGTVLGAMTGALWGRKGLAGVVGFVMITLLGGFAGLMLAGLLGWETQITASGNSLSVEHGAPKIVLLAGAVVGLLLGALGAWWFGSRNQPLTVPASAS